MLVIFQSPASMKSCIMAAWLLTVSVGNLIVVIFAEARFFYSMVREIICQYIDNLSASHYSLMKVTCVM